MVNETPKDSGEVQGAQLPESAEHVLGRVKFLRSLFDESIEEFLVMPQVQYGHHEQAEHSINLLLMVMYTYKSTYGNEGEAKIIEWLSQKHMLLNYRDPLEYLGQVEDYSDSLWLGVAMNELPGKYMWVTDEGAAGFYSSMHGLFEATEAENR